MPIYEFECGKCGRVFEVLFRSTSDEKRPTCPGCGARSAKRIFSSFGVGPGSKSSACGTCTATTCSTCSSR